MNSVFKPVEIKAYTDILNAISRFKSDYVDRCSISSELVWGVQGENGSIREEKATISIKDKSVTMRQLLVDGFDQVKEQEKLFNSMREALNEDEFAPTLPAMDIDHFNLPVDKLIKIRLGGKRRGYKVMWDLNGKVYELDPYTCELKEMS